MAADLRSDLRSDLRRLVQRLPPRLPPRLQRGLVWARSAVAHLQRLPLPPADQPERPIPALPRGLTQPDRTTCGSSVLVAMRMLAGDRLAVSFGDAALATRRRTNALFDIGGHLQLPWPAELGTRPAALIRHLGGGWRNRVVDPRTPRPAYDAIVAWVRTGQPVPLYIGEGSWMQHIVLVVGAGSDSANDSASDYLDIYDPACGEVLRRSREQFESGGLRVAGWDQPWLVILPRA